MEIYQASTFANCCGKGAKDSDGGTKPLSRPRVVAPGLKELLDTVLLIEFIKNGAGRFTELQLSGEWMCDKVILRLLAIPCQGSDKNSLKIG